MKNKRFIVLLIILILILIISIIAFGKITRTPSSGGNNSTGVNNQTSYKDEKLTVKYEQNGKYEPSLINDEYTVLKENQIKEIDKLIDDVLSYLNEKIYIKLFDMMSSNYKIIKYDGDLLKFADYLDENYKSNSYKCESYKIEDYALHIKIVDSSSSDSEPFEIKIQNVNYPEIRNLYFEDVKEIIEATTYSQISDVIVNMNYITRHNNKVVLNITLNNTASKDMNVEFNKYSLSTILNGTENLLSSEEKASFVAKANEKTKIELVLPKAELMFKPSYFEFELVVNGKTEKDRVSIQYDEIDDDY
ncbi:MAG: hypothetical protein J6C46_09340 [Clostridia bacterium]|nr:hypothetical protein [Clostridia bacterium]